ncbi:MAG: hypothetical protein ABI589_06880 [Burkholderiales bacterium]
MLDLALYAVAAVMGRVAAGKSKPHRALGIDASCRLSFYLHNTLDEVDRAVDVLATLVPSP